MSANEPPNPYAPGAAALADAAPKEGEHRPSRVLAAVTSFLAFPLLGTGFVGLGRRRRFAVWLTVGLLLLAAMILGVRLPERRLFMFGFVGLFVAHVLAVIDTARTRPGNGLVGARAWVVAIALVLSAKGGARAIKYRLAEAFSIPSGAMVPTLLVGDHIYVKKGRSDIARGDVIVFEFPGDRSTDYIKRVVALGGDTVEVRRGIVLVNDAEISQAEILNEPNPCPGETGEQGCYYARETPSVYTYTIMFTGHTAPDAPPIVVPPGHVYVLGDNRDNSSDSRVWGTVPVDHIKGTATVIWWSKDLSRVGRAVD